MKQRQFFCASLAAVLLLLSGCAGGDVASSDVSAQAAQTTSSQNGSSATVSSQVQTTKTTSKQSSQSTSSQTASTATPTQPTMPQADENWVELFKDGKFEKGLKVTAVDRSNKKVFDFGDSNRKSGTRWNLTQHFSKYDLITATPTKNADGSVSYVNPGKRVTLRQENGENILQMEMLASKEYDKPRQAGEDWPHLLIEQNLGSDTLNTYDQMMFTMTIRKDYIRNVMGNDYDAGLHCYQTGMIFIVQNMNTQSKGYGNDYFWFGVPGFDSREEYKSEYANIDGGKADASGKFIYQVGGKDFYDTYYTANPMTNEGKWCTVTVDILPAMKKAFNTAQRLGYMVNSKWEDMRVQGTNFGCECTGTFDASISIKNVSLLCHKTDK